MTKKILYLLLIAFSISLVSCEKETEVPSIPEGGELTGDISNDMVFKTGIAYTFDGTIRVRNTKLTFEATSLMNAKSPLSLSHTHIAHIAAHGISVDEDSSVDISNHVTFEDLDGVEYHVR